MTTKTRLLLPHHSGADWDFQNALWLIDATQFVSPPTSLKGLGTCSVLAKNSYPSNIPNGQLTTSFRGNTTTRYLHLFTRNQATIGSADYQDTYLITRRLDGASASCIVRRWVGGGSTTVGSFGGLTSLPANTWHQFRLHVWESWGAAHFRLFRYYAGAWNQEGSDVIDPLNKWADSSINRSGILLETNVWYDDTEICWP